MFDEIEVSVSMDMDDQFPDALNESTYSCKNDASPATAYTFG